MLSSLTAVGYPEAFVTGENSPYGRSQKRRHRVVSDAVLPAHHGMGGCYAAERRYFGFRPG